MADAHRCGRATLRGAGLRRARSHYRIAGALFQWEKIYAAPLLNNLLHTNFSSADPNQILLFTVVLILVQLAFNIGGVNYVAIAHPARRIKKPAPR